VSAISTTELPGLWLCLFALFSETVIFTIFGWYAGQVIPSLQGGVLPWYFPFDPKYWGFKEQREIMAGDRVGEEQSKSQIEEQIRTYNLSMSFEGKGTALKELTLAMDPMQCTCVLGQNGAGKSTLCNILTGLLTATHGEAFVHGHDLQVEMSDVRRLMGICPQDNLLYEELSGLEHLVMYNRFRGVPYGLIQEECDRLLKAVRLQDHGEKFAVKYSGGMQRRLCVALANVGSPKIIYLDEPTTGMDPLSRRRLWEMLLEAKGHCTMVLTTHSMEEADLLGDKIAILNEGHLRAYGDSLYLKSRFGTGYEITLVMAASKVGAVRSLVEDMIPMAIISVHGGTTMSVSVPVYMYLYPDPQSMEVPL